MTKKSSSLLLAGGAFLAGITVAGSIFFVFRAQPEAQATASAPVASSKSAAPSFAAKNAIASALETADASAAADASTTEALQSIPPSNGVDFQRQDAMRKSRSRADDNRKRVEQENTAHSAVAESGGAKKDLSGPELYEQCRKSVVVIRTDESLGSGFVVNNKIITNVHVINHAHSVSLKDPSGKSWTVDTILSADPNRDVAVLQMPAGLKMPSLEFAAEPNIGDTVYAIGAPRGLDYTITRGVVSQIRRLKDGLCLIQTDASISPGSSGGPLLNSSGQVVGVSTLASRASLDANNLNFAVSAEDAKTAMKFVMPVSAAGQHYTARERTDSDFGLTTDTDAGSGAAENTNKKSSDRNAVRELEGAGISLEVPKDWSIYNAGRSVLGAKSGRENRYDTFEEYVIVLACPNETMPIETFYQDRYRLLGHHKTEVIKALKSMEKTTVCGCEARRILYSNVKDGTIFIEYLIKSDTGFFVVMMECKNSEFGKWKPQMDAIVESIKIKER